MRCLIVTFAALGLAACHGAHHRNRDTMRDA